MKETPKHAAFEIDEVGLPVFRGRPDAPATHMSISEILAQEQITQDEEDLQRCIPQSLDGPTEPLTNPNPPRPR